MQMSAREIHLIEELRRANPAEDIPSYSREATFGERMADRITALAGSWRFLVVQSGLLVLWVALNAAAYIQHWDPYPFILLNLLLSFQAAYAAPIILMSQNRAAQIDRAKLDYYYNVNIKQELEIELLHQKLDAVMAKLGIPFEGLGERPDA